LLDQFNNITPKTEFTIEKETEGKINFLDITITRDLDKLSTDIYRKPTYSDAIIPHDSCHPTEHKLAAIRYLYDRMNMYELSSENLQKENSTILQILHNNGFESSITKSLHRKKKQGDKDKTQWAKFTHIGKETRDIIKACKNTNMKITYSANNTIGKLLMARRHHTESNYDKCGIYQIKCPTCNKKYIGQNPFSRTFQRFQTREW